MVWNPTPFKRMSMKSVKTFENVISRHCEVEITEDVRQEIVKMFEEFGGHRLRNAGPVVAKQIELGITNLSERFRLASEQLSLRDSSSLRSFVIRYGEEHGPRLYEEKNDRSKQTLKKYIEKYGDVDGPLKYNDYCVSKTHSLESYKLRYGELDGATKFREFWENTNFSTSPEAFQRRHGDGWIEAFERFREVQSHNNSLERYVSVYGETEGIERYESRLELIRTNLSKPKFVKKLLESGVTEEEIKTLIHKRWSRDLEFFVWKYGETEGVIRYTKFVGDMKKNNPLCEEYYRERGISEDEMFLAISNRTKYMNSRIRKYSEESLSVMKSICDELESNSGSVCLHSEMEYCITLNQDEYNVSGKRNVFYDFTFPELNIIIEYHGSRFHDVDVDPNSTKGVGIEYFRENFNVDSFKKYVAESRGFELFTIRSWNKTEDLLNLHRNLSERGYELCKENFF